MGNDISSSSTASSASPASSARRDTPTQPRDSDAPSSSSRPIPRQSRGISVVDAIYGDLTNVAHKCANVTGPIQALLDTQPLVGGKHLTFTLPKDSKNNIPGVGDPALRVVKKMRLALLVDGVEVTHVLDEYAALTVQSAWMLDNQLKDKLQAETYFEEDELQLLYEGFLEAAWPTKVITMEKFVLLFPNFNNPYVLKSLFASLDKDGDMNLMFHEYANGMSMMTRGTLDQRIRFAFSILDLDKSGDVDRIEVVQFAEELATVMNKCGEEVFAPRHVIEMLFQTRHTRALNSSTQPPMGVAIGGKHKSGMFGNILSGGAAIMRAAKMEKSDSDDDFGRLMKDQGEQIEDEESGEVEERDEKLLFLDHLSYADFKERARNEPDIANCFGLFKFFNDHIVIPMETVLEGEKEYNLSGWLHKDKSNNALLQTFSGIASDRRYFSVESGLLAYYRAEKDVIAGKPLNVVSLASCSVSMGPDKAAWFRLCTPLWTRHMFAENRKEAKRWVAVLRNNTNMISENRFQSFAGLNEGIRAKWFNNGMPYFEELRRVLPRAKRCVYIADWYFSPGLYLMRGEQLDKRYRLDNYLKALAERGVHVYIIIWNASMAIPLEPKYVIEYMNSLHPNIHAIRHPTFTPITWSHHQKFVVVDEEVAFVGGVDLCYTRCDDDRYLVTDVKGHNFPGRDYGNLNFVGEANGPTAIDVIDRTQKPRMPWHDIHMLVDGDAARNVGLNFLQRWNHAMRSGCAAQLKEPIYLLPITHASPRSDTPSSLLCDTPDLTDHNICQVLRSACAWSAGMVMPEQSIYRGYLHAIKNAKHFIYIENQYFISSITRVCPKNRIAEAVYLRLKKAISEKEDFRVIIVIPVFPAGDVLAATTRYIIKYVYKTVCRQGNSLFEKLQLEFPNVRVEDYVSFYSLRNWGLLNNAMNDPVTEQVYIHAKLMIVDDRIAIIGSANINDRSMRGTRDSEICIYLETPDEHCVKSTMAGRPFLVSPFVHTLRKNLFESHLGFRNGSNTDESLRKLLVDPVSMDVYSAWMDTARMNTFTYNKVFHYSLPDTVYTLADLRRLQKMAEEAKTVEPDKLLQWNKKMIEDLQAGIRGYLVEFPLNFLKDEQMSPQIWNVEFMVPRNVFL